MSDDELMPPETDGGDQPEPGDDWVSNTGWTARRAPGIDDVPDTTYVDQPNANGIPRRTLIIGAGVVLASIAIGLGFVLAANSGSSSKGEAQLSAAATLTSSSTRPSTTTSTATSSTTTAPSGASATTVTTKAAVVGATTPATAATAPATPRATANPALPPYQPVPIPTGVSATLGGCGWQAGQLLSSGTITSHMSTTKVWTVTMHWIQNSRELAQTHLLTELTAGQAKPWTLNLGAPNPPADLTCYLEVS